MKLTPVLAGYFRLDGGAMFGIVPKRLWNKLNPADDDNMCPWALRCLLVETGDRKILIDTGIGNKQGEKFRDHFRPFGDTDLKASLARAGVTPADITDVLLTHLHFDHVGGALEYDANGRIVPTFPNARYWTNRPHLEWALKPNARERASFLKENIVPLREAGVLEYIEVSEDDVEWLPGIRLRFLYGHTEAMMMPLINTDSGTVVYCADLMPASYHIPLPWIIAYDLRPLETLKEKQRLLEEALAGDYLLFFEHDPETPLVRLRRNEKGRIVAGERYQNFTQAGWQ